MHFAAVGGDHPVLAVELGPLAEHPGGLIDHPLAVLGMDQALPERRVAHERFGLEAEQLADLGADPAQRPDLVELRDVRDGGDLLHELAVPRLGLGQALAQLRVVGLHLLQAVDRRPLLRDVVEHAHHVCHRAVLPVDRRERQRVPELRPVRAVVQQRRVALLAGSERRRDPRDLPGIGAGALQHRAALPQRLGGGPARRPLPRRVDVHDRETVLGVADHDAVPRRGQRAVAEVERGSGEAGGTASSAKLDLSPHGGHDLRARAARRNHEHALGGVRPRLLAGVHHHDRHLGIGVADEPEQLVGVPVGPRLAEDEIPVVGGAVREQPLGFRHRLRTACADLQPGADQGAGELPRSFGRGRDHERSQRSIHRRSPGSIGRSAPRV